MQVTPTNAAAPSTGAFAAAGNSSLTMDDFFTLMAAELQNQTMYDTVDNAQYMGQLAQFSILSQLQSLSQQFNAAYATSMIGRTVEVKATDGAGQTVYLTGPVEQVMFSGGVPSIVMAGMVYDLSSVTLVG